MGGYGGTRRWSTSAGRVSHGRRRTDIYIVVLLCRDILNIYVLISKARYAAALVMVDDEVQDDVSPEGVDGAQIRWMLSPNPTEHLVVLPNIVDTFTPRRHDPAS